MAKTMTRMQVRTGAKGWGEKGPDLLRRRPNARSQVRALMAGTTRGWRWRRRPAGSESWGGWSEPGSKSDALDAFGRWGARDGSRFQLAADNKAPVITIWAHAVPLVTHPGLGGKAREWFSLVAFAHPGVLYAGALVCKRYNGSKDPAVGCSDHAPPGVAADATEHPPKVKNDRVTDWSVRMARTGNDPTNSGYVLGSRNGKTVSANAPDWEIEVDDAISDSHLWHVHRSLVDHDGRCPCGPKCRLGCK
jgi:hypothetical protein